jgi:hypothetical protein
VGNQPRLLLRLQQRKYGKSSALSDVAVRGMNPRYKRMTKRKKQEPAFTALSYRSERGWAGRSFFRLGLPLHHHNRGLSRPWLRGHLCPCSAVSAVPLQSYLSPLSVWDRDRDRDPWSVRLSGRPEGTQKPQRGSLPATLATRHSQI